MNREVHVRFWEGLGVRFPRATRLHSEVPTQDAVWRTTPALGRGVPSTGRAEGEPCRGRTSDARSRAHDDFDPAEVRRVAGDWVHQRKERDSSGTGIWRTDTQFRRAALLGQRLFRIDGRARRSGYPRIHSPARGRRQALGSAKPVAWRNHLQVAPLSRGRVSDPDTAALSGSQPKAPGFAGG
jgi:hypothetical protein